MIRRAAPLVLVAGGLALSNDSTANAEMVTETVNFTYDFSLPYPGGSVEDWFISHDFELTYDTVSGIQSDFTSEVGFTFDFGGEQISVDGRYDDLSIAGDSFAAEIEIPNAPFGFGPMRIAFGGPIQYNEFEGWSGQLTATIAPGDGFVGEEYTVNFTGQVVPAPGVVALFGLAGLAGRRRRH